MWMWALIGKDQQCPLQNLSRHVGEDDSCWGGLFDVLVEEA